MNKNYIPNNIISETLLGKNFQANTMLNLVFKCYDR
jgi:hypothetical protein